jgi:hypothetical protein
VVDDELNALSCPSKLGMVKVDRTVIGYVVANRVIGLVGSKAPARAPYSNTLSVTLPWLCEENSPPLAICSRAAFSWAVSWVAFVATKAFRQAPVALVQSTVPVAGVFVASPPEPAWAMRLAKVTFTSLVNATTMTSA